MRTLLEQISSKAVSVSIDGRLWNKKTQRYNGIELEREGERENKRPTNERIEHDLIVPRAWSVSLGMRACPNELEPFVY